MLLFLLLKGLSSLFSYLPAKPARTIFWNVFGLIYELSSKRKKVIQANYQALFPQETNVEIKKMAKNSFRHYGVLIHEFLLASHPRGVKKINFEPNVKEVALNQLFNQTKEGIILVTGHFGNWDLGGHYLMRFAGGKKVNVIADSLSGGYGRFVKYTREKLGLTVIDSTKEIKKAYQALKNGEIVVTVYDRPLSGEPNMSIGSVPVRFPEGVARMAFETGAACIFGAAYRDPISSTHPFTDDLFNPTTLKMDKKQLMQKLSESFWKLIKQYPDQWYVFRKLQS